MAGAHRPQNGSSGDAGRSQPPEGVVIRLRDGQRWTDDLGWSTFSDVGWFRLSRFDYRFDRHFHDFPEYLAVVEGRARVSVGNREHEVGPGDLVCTPAGMVHDILECHSLDLLLLYIEETLPVGGVAGHRHREPADAAGHDVPHA